MGVNALTHIATAVVDRTYNPGLWTAIAGLGWQLIGLAFALGVHAGIMGYIRGRARPHAAV
jgi:Protein of unknown function with HXXEE motif